MSCRRHAKRFLPSSLLASILLLTGATRHALAGHPMLTEDTGTQGIGNAELELGSADAEDRGTKSFLFQPQLSFGATTTLDLIVQPSWFDNRGDIPQRGLGDTALDVKWRFYGRDPISLAVRTGLTVPTAQDGLGLPAGHVAPHAVLVATIDAAPLTFEANVGITRNPDIANLRTDVFHVSAALLYAASERLSWVIDVDADSNPDPRLREWPSVALVGAIYTVVPGLDIDSGFRASLNRAAVARQWLLGVTYRWAP